MRNVKQMLLVILGVLLAVVFLQNTAPVRIQFLWMAGQISTVLLLILTAVGGFVMGVIVTLLLKGRSPDSQAGTRQKE